MSEENHLPLTVRQKLDFLEELLGCGDSVPLWVYHQDLHLARTNSGQLVLNLILEHSGCLSYMKSHFEHETVPVILSSHLGLMWCAARGNLESQESDIPYYIVIGPVLNTNLSEEVIRKATKTFNVDMSWRKGFVNLMQSLPVLPLPLLFQYALMLHYCLTGEKLNRSDIAFQESEELRGKTGSKKRTQNRSDRFLTYRNEQAILNNVRTGNLDYKKDLERGHQLSNGVRAETGDPIRQAILTTSTFTSLCVRAAIEGGLTPDMSYALGDSYIQSLLNCKNITDVRAISHTMYEDFIQRVRKARDNPQYTKQIRSCIDYIELNLTEDLSIRTLAERAGYTEYYLSRRFKEETGTSVKDYINRARIDHARLLLATTDLPVAEIASRLRFCSSSYFSSRFREVTGILPNRYREQTQKV